MYSIRRDKFSNIFVFGVGVVVICLLTCGCEAFVRKFTRKAKKSELPQQEMVLEPVVYDVPKSPAQERYRQALLFWKSWHGELIDSLSGHNANQKRQVNCVREAIANLQQMRSLLNSQKQALLDVSLASMRELEVKVAGDTYGNNVSTLRLLAEKIKRNILKDLSYNKISKDIVEDTGKK
ncbi:MAG: hypothetical protein WDL87_01655 [Candidatus Omnitrophota bacterium]|jgi:hypothetical protein